MGEFEINLEDAIRKYGGGEEEITPRQRKARSDAQAKREKKVADDELKQRKKELREKQKQFNEEKKQIYLRRRLLQNTNKYEEKFSRDFSNLASIIRNVPVAGLYGKGGDRSYSGYRPKGFSGEPQPPKKGGGLGGGLGGAMAGGAAAAGTFLLVMALKKATDQSKILGVVESSVGKALGLLIDLILLPFLPLIIWSIINLYNAIIAFGISWNAYVGTDPVAALMALNSTLGLGFLALPIALGMEIGKWIIANVISPIVSTITNSWNGFVALLDPWITAAQNIWTTFTNFITQKLVDMYNLIAPLFLLPGAKTEEGNPFKPAKKDMSYDYASEKEMTKVKPLEVTVNMNAPSYTNGDLVELIKRTATEVFWSMGNNRPENWV
jgi:hypothetical protein